MTSASPTKVIGYFSGRFAFLLMLVGLMLAFCFKGLVTAPPTLAETQAATGFDTQRAIGRLARILGDERPHPVDSRANDLVRERLMQEIRAMGYRPEVRDDFSCRGNLNWGGMSCARVRNVVFRTGPVGGNGVLVAAHYDSVPAGPGASDDGAGVAAALEIAALLRGRTLSKPVIFLLSDGEEAGLLGAKSFVRTDPWAQDVSFAVNMEARGTGGPAIMFQTSSPNGRDIAALTHGRVRTVANSMAADIYRLLPNDTDATEFLGKGYDGVNFAFIEPLARYHTPLDSLAYLEAASVGHMGAAALAAVEGHLLAAPSVGSAESTVIYSDVLGQFVLVLPLWAGYGLLGLGLLGGLWAYTRLGPSGVIRAGLVPPVAMMVAGVGGFASLWLIDLVRPESQWWFANPLAGRTVIYATALLGALAGLWLGRGVKPGRMLASIWIWLSGLFLGLAILSPGAMILVAPAAGLAGLGLIWIGLRPTQDVLVTWFGLAAALILLVLTLPALDFAEAGLGLALGWGFGILSALLMLCALVPVWVSQKGQAGTGLATLIVIVFAGVASGLAPAYSPQIPRPLNIQHWHGGPAPAWVLGPGNDPAPASMQAVAPFRRGPIAHADGERVNAPAPAASERPEPARIDIMSAANTAKGRRLVLRVTAPGADEVVLFIPKEAQVSRVDGQNDGSDQGLAPSKPMDLALRCVGRACAQWNIVVDVGPIPAVWTSRTLMRRLGSEADALLKARPAAAQPIQGGDVRLTNETHRL
ncbi:aminopeptidase YwaD [Candidatus Phycosocius bacilliformis]|uniref:Aminopeptidase YwaD n=1 Tax=Candidatus Phycosocius bacilliformis TaxID=1445552 RepID=A0A2P2E9R0_9PROT|nr:M28 family peptidase [Candidatus Phycosocius bacilliformis]GBF57796.1 aminopeptidase YwaD [Candidatus Phycosocius bacilliformis]